MLLEAVWFRYGRRTDWTLRAVDAAVHPGDTVVVLGRNGAGKSTLLQLAAGVLRPVRGAVRDRPQVVGWVPERFPAEQPFTCESYLRHLAAVRGLAVPAATRTVHRWAERLGLTPHLDSRLADLSKGTAQKVGLAQALLVAPDLLVLDEPWEGLDSVARTMVPEIVAEVTDGGGAVLISDHRGEIEGLPGAVRWSVHDGTVHPDTTSPSPACPSPASQRPASSPLADEEAIVEIAVRHADLPDTVVRLRAQGHHVLGVRPTTPAAPTALPAAPAALPGTAALPGAPTSSTAPADGPASSAAPAGHSGSSTAPADAPAAWQ